MEIIGFIFVFVVLLGESIFTALLTIWALKEGFIGCGVAAFFVTAFSIAATTTCGIQTYHMIFG